jgi:signal transduction histidine kinase
MALKYGMGKPIELTVTREGAAAWLKVRDEGIGISESDQARIFEPFERAVSTLDQGGFGIGLWVVRKLVEAMDGAITVSSHPGKGSTFTVMLPLQPTQANQ